MFSVLFECYYIYGVMIVFKWHLSEPRFDLFLREAGFHLHWISHSMNTDMECANVQQHTTSPIHTLAYVLNNYCCRTGLI